ncbi:MAG TPA: ABC transporter permease, partial [Blastocatellia bacterium]
MLNKLRLRLRALFFKPKMEQELDEEVRFHLEREIEENIARGMTPEEARYAAIRSFGGVERVKEESRDVRGIRLLEGLWQDLRFGARMLLKNPGFTLVAVIMLALGIGANTAIFSLTNALVLRPFDFPDLDRLVMVSGTMLQHGSASYGMTPADYADLRRQQTAFVDLAAYQQSSATITGVGEPERVQNVKVAAGFFRLLGGEAVLGRMFLPEEEQAGRDQVAVLSYDLWQQRFGADPRIVGATVSLDGKAHTVIGVMPESFNFPRPVELWTPLALGNEAWNERQDQSLSVVARLKPGVELGQANAEVGILAQRLATQYPQTNTGRGLTIKLLRQRANGEYSDVFVELLMAAVGFVLLIACVNIANMQLARASARGRELAVRAALGAGRSALVRQLLTESLLLGLLGGICGLLVSFWFLNFIRGSFPPEMVRYIAGWEHFRINERVMTFTFLIALASSVIFGLVPALQSSRPNLNETLKEGGRSDGAGVGRQRLRKALIVAEVALALVLLVGSGLMVKGFARLTEKQHQGFDPRHVLTLRTILPWSRYAEARQIATFHRLAQERLAALPGVESASSASFLPGSDNWDLTEFQIEGRPAPRGQEREITYQKAGADYFRTVRIPIVKGRAFSGTDAEDAPRVAVISEALARRYFPNEDPLGRRVKVGTANTAPWHTIIGVAGDVSRFMFDRETQPILYLPNQQIPDRGAYLFVRTS